MAEPPKPNVVPQTTQGGTAAPPRPIPPTPRPTSPPSPPPEKRGVVLPLILLILLALIGGFVYLAAAEPQQLFALLESAGVPAPGGSTQVADLQRQVRTLQQRPTTDTRPLEQRIASLEQRIGAVENRPEPIGQGTPTPAAAPAPVVDLAPFEQRLAALEQRNTADSAVKELAGRLQAVEQSSQTTAAQASRTARLTAAAVALDAGKPLGDIPGAPPALARFATAAPPTLQSLRQSFPAAEIAAEHASAPPAEGQTFAQRMLQQAQKLVTVRSGETVLVGAPAAHALTQAHIKLDIGDLAGAVAALDGLDAEAAQAMKAWRDQAQALLDARSALAGLANS